MSCVDEDIDELIRRLRNRKGEAIGASDRLLLSYLWALWTTIKASAGGNVQPFVFPDDDLLAEHLGCSERAIRGQKKRLIAEGLIRKEKRVFAGSKQWSLELARLAEGERFMQAANAGSCRDSGSCTPKIRQLYAGIPATSDRQIQRAPREVAEIPATVRRDSGSSGSVPFNNNHRLTPPVNHGDYDSSDDWEEEKGPSAPSECEGRVPRSGARLECESRRNPSEARESSGADEAPGEAYSHAGELAAGLPSVQRWMRVEGQ